MATVLAEKRERTKQRSELIIGQEQPVDKPSHPLDAQDMQSVLSRLRQFWRQARRAQAENRKEMAKDEAFYDGDQWDDEDKLILEARFQLPLVFNVVKTTVNWILGSERKARVDYRVLPRRKEGSDDAENKTKLLKYLSDVNKSPYIRSQVFEEAVKAGVGWLEEGVRSDYGNEPLFERPESWRNIWYDHLSMQRDMSDARFVFRSKVVDLDWAQAMFPDRAASLKVEAENVNKLYPYWPDDEEFTESPEFDDPIEEDIDADCTRPRVRIVECWYRQAPQAVKVVKSPDAAYDGSIYDPDDPVLRYLVDNGFVGLVDAVRSPVFVAIWCGGTFLMHSRTPYRHNRLPFIPIWCYRKAKDNAPYGVIRDLRDPQSDLNKRMSKAQFLLSSNLVITEEGAAPDLNEAYQEAQIPNGMVVLRQGKLAAGAFQIRRETALAAEHVQLANQDRQFIEEIGGVTNELMGRETNAVSGAAIQARQSQGMTSTSVVFDNMYYALQSAGEMQLSLIEQFYDEAKVFRLTGESSMRHGDFVEINVADDITAMKADFVISQQDYRETIRRAQFTELMELMQSLANTTPDIAMSVLDLVFEMSDIPNRDEFVSRIRAITGQKDPGKEMTPEEQVMERQQAQAEAEAQQRQHALVEAAAQADVSAKEAQALKAQVEAQAKRLEMMEKAMSLAGMVAVTPGLTAAADTIMEGAQDRLPAPDVEGGQ